MANTGIITYPKNRNARISDIEGENSNPNNNYDFRDFNNCQEDFDGGNDDRGGEDSQDGEDNQNADTDVGNISPEDKNYTAIQGGKGGGEGSNISKASGGNKSIQGVLKKGQINPKQQAGVKFAAGTNLLSPQKETGKKNNPLDTMNP